MERQQQGTDWKALAAATAAGCAGFAGSLLAYGLIHKHGNEQIKNAVAADAASYVAFSSSVLAGVVAYHAVHKNTFVDALEEEREQHEATLSR